MTRGTCQKPAWPLAPAPAVAAALVLDEFYEYRLNGSLAEHLSGFWNRVDLAKCLLLTSAGCQQLRCNRRLPARRCCAQRRTKP